MSKLLIGLGLFTLLCCFVAGTTAGCDRDNAKKAGDEVESAAAKTGEAVNRGLDKAGEAANRGINNANNAAR